MINSKLSSNNKTHKQMTLYRIDYIAVYQLNN